MRAADLCRQMLAYSGKGRFMVEPVDLSEVVDEMARMLEVSVTKKAILKYDLPKGLPLIIADIAQIQQVVMNLIINASESIGDRSGTVFVKTGIIECSRKYLKAYQQNDLAEGNYVFLEVTDNGCGMDKAILLKIFDPFFTTKFIGRGLGLSAVQGIVNGHKGAIRIYSEPGRGTTFKVLFPVSDMKLNQLPIENNEDKTASNAGGIILLVDDEESIRSLGKVILEGIGFSVLTALNGLEAINIFNAHKNEITGVILDLTMPVMDGEETFSKIRLISPDIPVILSSGYNELEAASHFSGKNLSGFIQKPYTIKNLKEVLTKAFKG